MDDNTTKVWMGWIGLASSILTPIVTALIGYVVIRVRQGLADNTRTTNQTHEIVNSERTQMRQEITDLKKQLTAVQVAMDAEHSKHPAVERTVEHIKQAIEVAKESP